MTSNIKVENFYNEHRSNIILASHTQTGLESMLRDLFQEMYELGHADGHADGWAESWAVMNELEEKNGNL